MFKRLFIIGLCFLLVPALFAQEETTATAEIIALGWDELTDVNDNASVVSYLARVNPTTGESTPLQPWYIGSREDFDSLVEFAVGGNMFSVSPDSTQIAYTAWENGAFHINIIDIDGDNKTVIAQGLHPEWSPDGSKILYDFEESLFVMNTDGSDITLIAAGGVFGEWSPDGSQIAYYNTADQSLYLVNADGTNAQLLSTKANVPAWSPDGSQVAYYNNESANVHVVGANGDDNRYVALDGGFPRWDPDGSQLAYYRIGGVVNLVFTNGNNVRQLITRTDFYYAWSPDGSQMAATIYPAEELQIRSVNGSQQTVVVEGKHMLPVWFNPAGA